MNRRNFIQQMCQKMGCAFVLTSPLGSWLTGSSVQAEESQTHHSEPVTQNSKPMKIVVITGSPRRAGNSSYLADQFIKGAKEKDHEVFRFDAAFREVKPCIACNKCGMDGPCAWNDSFSTVLRAKLLEADLICLCSPMYYFGFTSQIKAVIDRFYAITNRLHGHKKACFLMTYANNSSHDEQPMRTHYQVLLDYMGWTNAGIVIAPGVWTAGSIKNTQYGQQAYKLGKSL